MIATYSENLKKLREALGLSAQKLADKLGVSQGSIAQYEAAKREPNFNFLLQLNIKLNVNINWFLTGEGLMFVKKSALDIASTNKDEIIKIVEDYLDQRAKKIIDT